MRMKILNSIAVFLVLSISPIGAAEDFVEVKNVSAPPSDILSGRLRLAEPSALPTSAWTALVPFERALPELRTGPGKTAVALITREPSDWTFSLVASDDTKPSPDSIFLEQTASLEQLTSGATARVIRGDPSHVDRRVSIQVSPSATDSEAWPLIADGR